jgi:uncharacterized protein (TIGR03437 family)
MWPRGASEGATGIPRALVDACVIVVRMSSQHTLAYALAVLAGLIAPTLCRAQVITTVAGVNNQGYSGDGGPATSANFSWTNSLFAGVARDPAGNLYISDSGHSRVRKINTSGIITTVAGNGTPGSGGDGGPATSASLFAPAGIALDAAGNLYIADPLGGLAGTGTVGYTGDGGPATSAQILPPIGLAVDAKGNLYIAESGAAVPHVRKVDASGIITTFAGSGTSAGFAGDGGPATSAQLNTLAGLAVDQAGNLYIADAGNYRVRKVDTSGIITTVAGTGQIDLGGNGDGGAPISAALQPSGMALDAAGNLYIADYSAGRIRKIAFGSAPPGLSVSSTLLYFAGKSVNSSVPPQILTISSAGAPISFTVSATTTSGGAWLGAGTSSGTTPASIGVNVNNNPSPLSAGTYKGTLTITPTSPGYSPVTVAVTLVLSATVPAATAITSVQNGASNLPDSGIVPDSYLTIKGTNLASTTDTWDKSIVGGQLPTVLDGVTVTFYGVPGYISYISPTQINVLVPPIAVGSTSIQVINNGSAGGSATVGVGQYDPAFFQFSNSTQVIATRQDYSYAAKNGTIAGLATVPAKPGDIVILWGADQPDDAAGRGDAER